ncbi:HAD family hydrolase [Fretibacterium sp. OH1220_COT-178]|uniref:HAD family hydrolase n=1 Tax=Fretibacterium sp. OH1220_COT-178 TaxID=2491047 RepID=UPI0013157F40|nr:HAD family hydrolase [Fretibacterium sp. OH1220_COT-178]
MIKLMIFDHDMTIVDSSHAILAGINKVADSAGLPRTTHGQVMRCIALPLADFMVGTLGECRPGWLDLYREKVAPFEYTLIRPFPETEPTLTRLREMGLALAVASNRNAPRAAMEKTDTARHFDAIVGPSDHLPYKPEPGMLLHLMDRFGVPSEQTVYVGDSDIDVRTALAAKVRAIGITRGNFTREQFADMGAWRIIDALDELPSIVEEDERG